MVLLACLGNSNRKGVEMDILLEGGNWQCGICAGYFRTSFSHAESFLHQHLYPASWYREAESDDGPPQRWVAIIEAKRASESERTKAILNLVEMVIGRK